ncbi:MAG: acyltransferase, partial [Actinobacteria bacterium]|nr:acyltransferase [Actinomycetota bacterium]
MLFHTESRLVPAGFLGVDVFFVISGFLITDILFRGAGWSGLGGFWLRRARRLAPALMVLLVTVALLRLVHPGPGDSNPAPIVAALTYTTNWYEILTGGSYFGLYEQPTLLLHTW